MRTPPFHMLRLSLWYKGCKHVGRILLASLLVIFIFTLIVGIIILPLWLFATIAPKIYTIAMLISIISFGIFRLVVSGAWKKAGTVLLSIFLILFFIIGTGITILLAIAQMTLWAIMSGLLLLLIAGRIVGTREKN